MQIGGASGRNLVVGEGSTRLMGVVNVTPDSFYAGSRFAATDSALEHAMRLLDEGAEILDIGAESTRPGHTPVADDEQLRRVIPLLTRLRTRTDVPISIDTTRARVAAETLDAGADWINDTLALSGDAELAGLLASRDCPVVLMHRFTPARTPASKPPSDHRIVAHIAASLGDTRDRAVAAGIRRERLVFDPGIGFGTLTEDNLALHAHVGALRSLGGPLLFGPSRKSFLGRVTGRDDAADRLFATAASVAILAAAGVEILRVHDVAAMRDVVRVADAVRAHAAQTTSTGSEPWSM